MEIVHNYGFDFLGGTNVMPIGGFYLPTPNSSDEVGFDMPNFITDEYFAMMAESGINLIVYSEVFYDTHPIYVEKMLALGEKYGIGITVSDRRLSNADGTLTLEKVKVAVKDYRYHKAFCGVYGVDEPTSDDYTGPREHISVYGPKMNYVDDLGIWAYGNLLPCYNEDYREQYDRYVREWLDTCKVKMLMWDHYVHDKNVQTIDYFYSLSYGRAIAEEYGIPFWTFIQAGSQWEAGSKREDSDGYYPNEGEFLWNVNTSLAYGAKGISYFPLIQPAYFSYSASQPYDFERNGLIGASGNKNQWWHYAKKANKQIAAIDEVLMNSVSKGVIVTSDQAKADNADSSCVIKGTAWQELSGITGDVMVGCFNHQGKSAFYVVNYDMQSAQNITLKFSGKYAFEVIKDAEITRHEENVLDLNMTAGEGVLVVMI